MKFLRFVHLVLAAISSGLCGLFLLAYLQFGMEEMRMVVDSPWKVFLELQGLILFPCVLTAALNAKLSHQRPCQRKEVMFDSFHGVNLQRK
ncbi:MAG: hypothetical protein PHQ47_01800 [Candidatus Portnoybacteria bacterium]|nr:hypothetical protein [Candidatus Portnoybacteria bacterium]